ncbi:EAL domain-containing protein [Stenotrophomonas sp.]|uniref:putative bifunctional diguanylate cyclase/phosphodiesterase n=1 Tax=Stenotrophomonas sp. TaxID=69392 RepID=UPI0028A90880|nr:EAL domain-containing protein [Stenotrophomonas sp.]
MLGGGNREGGGNAVPQVTKGLTLRFVLLTGMAIGLVGISALIQELQAASTAWIVGQSHWSRGQQRATFSLARYIESGNPANLADARAALAVPLGDLDARLAMEQDDLDRERARQGLLRGHNTPADAERLILSFRYLGGMSYFRDAVQFWRRTDHGLLQLQQMADTAEAMHQAGGMPPDVRQAMLLHLQALDRSLQAHANAYSQSLLNTASIVRITTLIVGGLSVLLITVVAVLLARRVRNDLIEKESRFRAAFYQATIGMLKLDVEGRIVEANQSAADMLGYRRDTLIGMTLPELLVEGELVQSPNGAIDWPQQLRPAELRFRRADGSLLWGRSSGTLVQAPNRPPRVFAMIEDVSQNHALAREVEHQASHDPLTGLINRREIERRLERALLSVRSHGGVHSLCYIDLDYFKLVNDGLGHAAGDQLLRSLSEYLVGAVRDGDWVGRMGGDEFALFLAHAGQEDARQVLQRLMRSLGQAGAAQGEGAPQVRCSVGVVEITAEVADVNWLMSAADSACYAAKQAGRNRIHFYNETREALEERRREAERLARVSAAMAENRMLLFAQRIVWREDPAFLHYEVLVRLRGRDGQLHSPGEFMPAVERYGMSMALDRHVLGLLFRHLQVCPGHVQRLGLCNVNVSAQSITEPSFLAYVSDLLERNRGLARKLCFEVTETAAISNLEQARSFVEAVKARGCRVALDDFGSGLSSFGYLRQLPADMLKIDGVFVRDMDVDPVSRATVRAITEIGRELHMTVVAEWVESDEVADQLQALGVNGLQGYAVERPMALEKMTQSALWAARGGAVQQNLR